MSLHDHCGHRDQGSFFTSPAGRAVIGFSVIAGVLLFTEHRAHVLDVLFYLLLLLCPFMHVFMHGRRGRHGGHGQEDPQGRAS
jgi:hypothetical protein